jgi:RsmE family RNA methyltransferase
LNTLIFTRNEIVGDISTTNCTVRLIDERRLGHVINILRCGIGDALKVGLLDGNMGQGKVVSLSSEELVLDVCLDAEPPPAPPITLMLALPRPLVVRRLLADVTSLGIKKIFLFQSSRVEKSYWQSPVLEEHAVLEHLKKGLEQGNDTVLPKIELRRHFRSWIDELPEIIHGSRAFLAHPGGDDTLPRQVSESTIIAIGPEGGLTETEVTSFRQLGFSTVDFGKRILRVETAVSAILGRLVIP